ncbi:MAG: hypothetical protein AABX59_01275 [Nanoarchaeota archaeon]
MNKYTELIIGIVLLAIGIWGIYYFSTPVQAGAVVMRNGQAYVRPVLIMIEGLWGIFVAFIGLIFLILGISDMKG